MADRNISEIFGADSMNHVMKGNIGFFVSGGKHIICEDLVVSNIKNTAMFTRPENTTRLSLDGEKAFTHAVVASEHVTINGVKYNNTKLLNPDT